MSETAECSVKAAEKKLQIIDAPKMTSDQAQQMMVDGFHCSQVVISHIAQKLGLDVNFALRATAGLGAGTNHGDTCGAISAGVLALGILYGFDQKNAAEQDQIIKGKVKEFENRFIALHSSLLCRDLLNGFDAACPPPVAAPGTWDNCKYYCEDACAILDSMIAEYEEKR